MLLAYGDGLFTRPPDARASRPTPGEHARARHAAAAVKLFARRPDRHHLVRRGKAAGSAPCSPPRAGRSAGPSRGGAPEGMTAAAASSSAPAASAPAGSRRTGRTPGPAGLSPGTRLATDMCLSPCPSPPASREPPAVGALAQPRRGGACRRTSTGFTTPVAVSPVMALAAWRNGKRGADKAVWTDSERKRTHRQPPCVVAHKPPKNFQD